MKPGQADLRGRFNFGLAIVVFILAAIGLFLVLPLGGFSLNPAVVTLQTEMQALMALLSPYLSVGAIGFGVGLAELTSTFDDYPLEALATKWGQYLLWLNAFAAVAAFLVARIYAPPDTNIILLVISVGVGFPTLIRTKFTLAKQFGGEGNADLNVNIGWLYEQFQNLCKKQIDLELMTYRRDKVDQVLARYPTVSELYDTALYTLKARATLSAEEEAAKADELKKIMESKLPQEVTRLNLGLFILELGGVAYVDLLSEPVAAKEPAAAVAGGDEKDQKAIVRRLAELPLSDLKQRALNVLTMPEARAKVEKLSEPIQGMPEVLRRASIAQCVVDNVGPEAAQRLAEPGDDA